MNSEIKSSGVSTPLEHAGEHFRKALDDLMEAHRQDMRELERTLRASQRGVRNRMAAVQKGGDKPVVDTESPEPLSPGLMKKEHGNGSGTVTYSMSCASKSSHPMSAAAKLRAHASATFHADGHAVDKGDDEAEPANGASEEQTFTQKVLMEDNCAEFESRLNELIPGRARTGLADSRLKRIVSSFKFEIVSGGIVLVFCILTALQMQWEGLILGNKLGYPKYDNPDTLATWNQIGDVLNVLSFTCGILFVVEFGLRFFADRRQFVRSPWSYFDLVIILGWFAELIGQALGSRGGSRALRPARLARLLRFVRMVQVIRQLESLYFMICALAGSLKILGWSCLLLLAFQMLTAFVITEILNVAYFPKVSPDDPHSEQVFEYFGSFARSLLTTFEMALGNWPVPARVLFEHVSEWFMIIFLAHKLTVGFAVVGVINSVFIQETFQVAATDDLTMVLKKQKHISTQRRKLEKLFNAADTSKDGRINRDEFIKLLKNKEVQWWLASMEYHSSDPDGLFDMLDRDDTGDLSAAEFLKGMVVLRGSARAMDLVGLVDMQLEHDRMLKKLLQDAELELDCLQNKKPLLHGIPANFKDDESLFGDDPDIFFGSGAKQAS